MSKPCMQDTFARATHSAYAAGRPSAARDDRVSCIQVKTTLFYIDDHLHQHVLMNISCIFKIYFTVLSLLRQ